LTHGVDVELLGDVMVRVTDLQSRGHGFDSRHFYCEVITLGKLFTHVCLRHHARY